MTAGSLIRRAALAVVLASLYLPLQATPVANANGVALAPGDVLVGSGNGLINHYNSAGTQLDTLDTGTTSLDETGMCFDGLGRLRSTNYDSGSASLFSSAGALTASPWASGFVLHPESCVVDSAQNVYVGESDGNKYISKFDPSGNLLATYSPAADTRGSDWIDLAADQCTMYYTSEGNHVKSFNVCTNTQGSDLRAFSDASDPCYTVRIRTVDILVACTNEVYQLSLSDGHTLQSFSATAYGATSFFGLDLAPDGNSFWVADPDGHAVYHINIADGTLLGAFTVPSVSGTDGLAIAVVGAPTASGGTKPLPPGNQPPVAHPGGPYSGTEGAAIQLAGSVSDLEGDPTTGAWTVTPPAGEAGAACTFANSSNPVTTITCNDEGIYTLRLTATDTYASTFATTTVTIGDVAPVVTITTPYPNQLFGTDQTNLVSVPVNATFTDAGTADSHSCSIQWDTATAPVAGTVSETVGSGQGSCSATKALGPGVYCITVSVTETDNTAGNSAYIGSSTVQIVVYDPYAGFVSGGGTILSPAGAMPASPAVTGTASFGFVSKYLKGANVPTGETEFQFKVGNLNFHSTAYQWLVISGNMAQYKGTGTINGAGSYSFKITGLDGDMAGKSNPDGFRMRITDSGGGVIYDNVPSGCDACSIGPTQILSSGNIIVHAGS